MKNLKALSILLSLGFLFAATTSHAIINGDMVNDANLAKRVAAIAYSDDKLNTCTAIPITKTVLLTAAHCIHANHSQLPDVYFGTSTNSGKTRAVSKVWVMATYAGAIDPVSASVQGDIALIKLSDSIPDDSIVTDLLAPNDPIDSSSATVLGYGGRSFNAPAGVLRKASVSLSPSVAIGDSIRLYPELVTGGDSGGPILVTSNHTFKVYGINCTAIPKLKAFTVKDITLYREVILQMANSF